MTLDEKNSNLAMLVAHKIAVMACSVMADGLYMEDWICLSLGVDDDEDGESSFHHPLSLADRLEVLADFMRDACPIPETVFRYAAGQGFHHHNPDGWEDLALPWRSAYEAFCRFLPIADGILEEMPVAEVWVEALPPAPVPAAAPSSEKKKTGKNSL